LGEIAIAIPANFRRFIVIEIQIMNLTQELQNLLNQVASQVPAETLPKIGQSTQQIADLNIDRNALKVGEPVPNFSLPGATGQLVELQQLLALGPVVIAFYRGEWCPFCNLELHALQNALPSNHQRF
jgi:AhpC/TSA family